MDALEGALDCYGQPETFNAYKGAHFTSEAFTAVLLEAKITFGMHGNSRCMDNLFIERLWRSLKQDATDWNQWIVQPPCIVEILPIATGRHLSAPIPDTITA